MTPSNCRTQRNQSRYIRFREDVWLFYNLCLHPALSCSIFDTGGPQGWGLKAKAGCLRTGDLLGLLIPMRRSDLQQRCMKDYLPLEIGGKMFAIAGPAFFANHSCQAKGSYNTVRPLTAALRRSSLPRDLDIEPFDRHFRRRHHCSPIVVDLYLPRSADLSQEILLNYEPGNSFPFHRCDQCP